VLYIVHFTAFCLGGPFFSGHGVDSFQYFFLPQYTHEFGGPLWSIQYWCTISFGHV